MWLGFDFATEETDPKERFCLLPFGIERLHGVQIACNAFQGCPDLKALVFVAVPPYLELRLG
jgi:hypothetical protein